MIGRQLLFKIAGIRLPMEDDRARDIRTATPSIWFKPFMNNRKAMIKLSEGTIKTERNFMLCWLHSAWLLSMVIPSSVEIIGVHEEGNFSDILVTF
ncbi:hypothetical protein [Pantoea agglomerans]|uniref:hypothetical protein n=1 Tax=Enterobacter agglomerans TaxID=549 RepID=UPI001F5D95AE|nr:hypothetical protein [Pantoea agglomerans]